MTTDWKSLSVAELEKRYDQGVYAANAKQVNGWYTEQSQLVESRLGGQKFQYGLNASEHGYWFKPEKADADIVVFIHGGAWRIGSARDYLFPAPWLVEHGLNYVCLNFDNVGVHGGRLFPMLNQLVSAITWISRNYQQFGANPRIHIASHSSGSHLAACLASLDWDTLLPHAPRLIQSVFLCSGIYDLEPVVHSKRRHYLELSPLEVHALSPIRHSANQGPKYLVARGELESPEFIRQHDQYVAKLQKDGLNPSELVGPGLNHFEILTTFADAKGLLAQGLLQLIKQ